MYSLFIKWSICKHKQNEESKNNFTHMISERHQKKDLELVWHIVDLGSKFVPIQLNTPEANKKKTKKKFHE